MDILAIQKLVIKLLSIIATATPYGVESAPPKVHFVPQQELAERVCHRPCPVFALFVPEHGIIMDQKLNPTNDLRARSILLHELVHYVQWRQNRESAHNCEEWIRRESEAYSVQYNWLRGQPGGVANIPFGRRSIQCVASQFKKAGTDSEGIEIAERR